MRRWRRLAGDARARRDEMKVLLEGEHLIAAFLDAGGRLEELILSETAADSFESIATRSRRIPVLLSDSVFRAIADTDAPTGIAAEIALPKPRETLGDATNCVFLDGIQDAGNVGAILRCAAAFGIRHAVLGKGCADVWSPKVLRAGMGAHFALTLAESTDLAASIKGFGGKTVCTVPSGGVAIGAADLSGRIGWLLGAEGRGVSAPLAAAATVKVSIPMPGTAESLNVAAAAAICFYELSRRAARS